MSIRMVLRIAVLWWCAFLWGCTAHQGMDLSCETADRPLGTRIRVLSYNIHIGRGMDKRTDLQRTAEVIRKHNPDLVALQEVDKNTNRSAGVDQAAKLGELAGMQPIFCRALDLPGGEYGETVLSRWPVETTKCHPLPYSPGRESRSALEARVRLPGLNAGHDRPQDRFLRFIGTHLDHLEDPSDRIRQTATLADIVAADPAIPVILAGDFNDQPGSAALVSLGGNWLDTTMGDPRATYPSDKPEIRIDYVFARPASRWRLVSATVLDEPLVSDHRPVLTVLELLP